MVALDLSQLVLPSSRGRRPCTIDLRVLLALLFLAPFSRETLRRKAKLKGAFQIGEGLGVQGLIGVYGFGSRV